MDTVYHRPEERLDHQSGRISRREIEEALYLHPRLRKYAVWVSRSGLGEDICAVLQLKAGLVITEQDLQIHVAQYVTKFKIPAE